MIELVIRIRQEEEAMLKSRWVNAVLDVFFIGLMIFVVSSLAFGRGTIRNNTANANEMKGVKTTGGHT